MVGWMDVVGVVSHVCDVVRGCVGTWWCSCCSDWHDESHEERKNVLPEKNVATKFHRRDESAAWVAARVAFGGPADAAADSERCGV